MYCYILNSSAAAATSPDVANQIKAQISSARIEGPYLEIKQASDVRAADFLPKIPADTTTLVVIGDDASFESVLSLSDKLAKNMAYGYIPLSITSPIAQHLELKSHKEAVTTIRSRRLREFTFLRYSSGTVLFQEEWVLPESTADSPIHINMDGELELNLDVKRLVITNFQAEAEAHDKKLQIEAFGSTKQADKQASEGFANLQKLIPVAAETDTLLLRLPGNNCIIETKASQLLANGEKLPTKLHLQLHSHPIRLIVKKHGGERMKALS